MVMSDTSSMIDGFTIALLMSEFGQAWARFNIEQCAKETELHTTLGKIVPLHNCAVPQLWYDVTPQQIEWQNQLITYDAAKTSGAYSDGTTNNSPRLLDGIESLGNGIAYDFKRIIQLHSCGVPQLWHDVTPQQIEWQNQLITYDTTKTHDAYSDGTTNNSP